MNASRPLPAVAPHDVGAGVNDRRVVWARLGAGLAVAVGTWALILVIDGAAGWGWFRSAWITGVGVVAAADAFRPDDQPPHYLQWLVWSVPFAWAGYSFWVYGWVGLWRDIINISGWIAASATWSLARGTLQRMHRTLERLEDRQVLRGHGDGVGELSHDLDRIAHRWAVVGGGCIVVVLGVLVVVRWGAFGLLSHLSHLSHRDVGDLAALVPVFLAGFVVGAWAGRLAANGRVGALARRRQLRLRVIPGHPDGAGGLRPLGALFLRQSLVAAVPAAYFVVWLVILTFDGRTRFSSAVSFWWLLGVSIVIEILTFVAPMRSIHGIMRAEKERELWRESDWLSRQIEEIRSRLMEANVSDRGDQESQLAAMIGRVEALEATPTWPIDAAIRRRFTLQNLGLLLPFVGYAVVDTSLWARLSNLFTGLN